MKSKWLAFALCAVAPDETGGKPLVNPPRWGRGHADPPAPHRGGIT